MPTEPSTTVLKAFTVLELFRQHPHLGVSQCAEMLGMTRASAHRLLVSLTAAGALERTATGRYRLAIWMFEVGTQAPLMRALHDRAQVALERLAEDVRLQAHLAIREGTHLVYLLKTSHVAGRVNTRPGARNSLYATALGKVLLAGAPAPVVDRVLSGPLRRFTPHTRNSPGLLRAQLEEVGRTGFAYDLEERQLGVACLATAIRDQSGRIVAAISIPAPAESYLERLDVLRRPLQQAALSVEKSLQMLPSSLFSGYEAETDYGNTLAKGSALDEVAI
jgi:IclR family transcriptional regulator, KDG regulon repressor